MRVHFSAMDRYRGETRNLSQSFPLLRGSNGMVCPMLRAIFKMPSGFPMLSVKTSFGCYRKGVSQGRDAFLEGVLALMVGEHLVAKDASVSSLKESILQDLRRGTIAISDIGDGTFLQQSLCAVHDVHELTPCHLAPLRLILFVFA